jgi:hypothetical protein
VILGWDTEFSMHNGLLPMVFCHERDGGDVPWCLTNSTNSYSYKEVLAQTAYGRRVFTPDDLRRTP